MRATLAEPALGRYAGRFVWLELDFDKPVNQSFLNHHRVGYTPTLLVVDPGTDTELASHIGGMSRADLEDLLEVGERRFRGEPVAPADSLIAHADIVASGGGYDEAEAEAIRALALGGPEWPQRAHAYHTLTWAQMAGAHAQACAETAAAAAPQLPRGGDFGAVVLAGLSCAARGGGAEWSRRAFGRLEPLAEAAIELPSVIRDHRFQLYQSLMHATESLGDTVAARQWGHRWLDDIEATTPRDDDERSALDIARVDAAGDLEEPERVLPALMASERAMPTNYNASLRLAQMLESAKRYDEALAACGRGLEHVTGPLGRSWLLTTRANVYDDLGDRTRARAALAEALEVAGRIGTPALRASNVRRLTRALDAYDHRGAGAGSP